MAFKGKTASLGRRYDKLTALREEASDAIYAAALPRRDIGWQDCYRDYADGTTRERYDAARKAVFDFELAMYEQRRGWFDDHHHFNWYRRNR